MKLPFPKGRADAKMKMNQPEKPSLNGADQSGKPSLNGADSVHMSSNSSHLSSSVEAVYQFYNETFLPAVLHSLPLLAHRLLSDSYQFTRTLMLRLIAFVSPKWNTPSSYSNLPTLAELWQQYALSNTTTNTSSNATSSSHQSMLAEFMLRHFDTDGDGHISSAELLKKHWPDTDVISSALHRHQESWAAWFTREWPLMDWKVGVFLWRSFGGILVVLAFCSVMPGRLHGWSARILRWPVLGLVYFLILVELIVYIIIRVGIWVAEYIIARPKHRKLRYQMKLSESYDEWYDYAKQLDHSQKRDKWLEQVDDETSYEYNWGFILELIKEMRQAREKGDSILALAVIQQCTRKNVGGIMSEDLFSYSNTGAPKTIVEEFISEVVATLRWITDEAQRVGDEPMDLSRHEIQDYEDRLQREVRDEKAKLFGSLIDATIQDLGHDLKRSLSEIGLSEHKSDAPTAPSAAALPAFHRDQVLVFLKRARAAYGRTAFCMSGGAMLVRVVRKHCVVASEEPLQLLTRILSTTTHTGIVSLWGRSCAPGSQVFAQHYQWDERWQRDWSHHLHADRRRIASGPSA
jgi:hypothetical protein